MRSVSRCWAVIALLLGVAPTALAVAPPSPTATLIQIDVVIAKGLRGFPGLDDGKSTAFTLVAGVMEPAETHALMSRVQQQVREGRAKILAEPRLVTQSGRQANFRDGGQIPVVRPGQDGEADRVEFEPVGTSVMCLPILLRDGKIHFEYEVEFSEIECQKVGSPRNTQRTHSTIELKSGQTYFQGGLRQWVMVAKQERIPVLSDLPVVGSVFTWKVEQEEEQEWLFLVTATVRPEVSKP